jgi:hypothetical protein
VAAREPEVKPALTHNPEQLAAMAAAPFLFVQGRLRRRVVALRRQSARSVRTRSGKGLYSGCIVIDFLGNSSAFGQENECEGNALIRAEVVQTPFGALDGLEQAPRAAPDSRVKEVPCALEDLLR